MGMCASSVSAAVCDDVGVWVASVSTAACDDVASVSTAACDDVANVRAATGGPTYSRMEMKPERAPL